MVVPLRSVRYNGKDFATLRDRLLSRAQTKFKDRYDDFQASSLGMMLIELMAYGMEQIAWLSDRNASDRFLMDARTPEAVERIVRPMGYRMRPATPATTTIRLTHPITTVASVIPRGFRVEAAGLTFESISDTNVAAGVTVTNFLVREGGTYRAVFRGDGLPNQIVRLRTVPTGRWLSSGSFRVFVDGEQWAEKEFLEFAETNQFEVMYRQVPPEVRFGDGVAGTVPLDGADITVEYRVVSGLAGNLPLVDTVWTALDTWYHAGVAVVLTTVAATERATGGYDAEPIEETKAMAPLVLAARGAAVTLGDYRALAGKYASEVYGSVARASAIHTRRVEHNPTLWGYRVGIDKAVTDGVAYQKGKLDLVDTKVALTVADAAVVSGYMTEIGTKVTALSAVSTALDANAVLLIENASNAKGQLQEAGVAAPLIVGVVTAMGGGGRQLSTGQAAPAGSWYLASAAEMAVLVANSNKLNAMLQGGGTLDLAVQTIAQQAALVGSNSKSMVAPLGVVSTDRTAAGVKAVAIGSSAADIAANLALVRADMAAMVVSESGQMLSLVDWVNGQLDADCGANVVTVLIVGYDKDGFYVAPSSGLVSGTQSYLNGIKEVTQSVHVESGKSALLAVNIKFTGVVSPGQVIGLVQAKLTNVLNELLRGREFGEPLWLDEAYQMVDANVTGLLRYTIEFTSPLDHVVSGNVVPAEYEIITRGALTLNLT